MLVTYDPETILFDILLIGYLAVTSTSTLKHSFGVKNRLRPNRGKPDREVESLKQLKKMAVQSCSSTH